MDPNANLREQRDILKRVNDDTGEYEFDSDDLLRLAELVTALDEWISNGGFLPEPWLKSSAVPKVVSIRDPCCSNEQRNVNGGCDSCGAPCL